MQECKAASTPLDQNVKLSSVDETKEVNGTVYRQLVGRITSLLPSETYHTLSTFLVNSWLNHLKAIG